jgi:nitrous-oxide reductase
MKGTGNVRKLLAAVAVLAIVAATFFLGRIDGRGNKQPELKSPAAGNASRVYVAPGKYDEFYGFFSGGFSGQVLIYGIPSARLIQIIPVFSQSPEDGYGFSEETKALLTTSHGFVPWDDAHHPELSQTNGVPDGRWLFINANNTPRIARLDLRRFRTDEILEIPHTAGLHSAPFVTENTEYVVAGTRFSVPIPQKDLPIADYKGNFKGTLNFINIDPKSGRMSIAFQILMPGYDYDLAHCGKGPSADWCFFTTYNTEEAHTMLEINASQFDKDFTTAVNWKRAEQCVADGRGKAMDGDYFHNYMDEATQTARSEELKSTTVLTPQQCPDMVYFLPTPKSPHGVDVDPTGQYIVTGAKLSSTLAVHSFSKMLAAIKAKEFEGQRYGVPVLKFEDTLAGEVKNACLGPLHDEFDANGNVYTSCFISSEIIKWKLGTWQIEDRIPVYYAIGHLMIPGGDSAKPWGKYVIALNKMTKDRFLPTGPEMGQSAQLIDISGSKMRLLLDFPTVGEPHYAQAIPASVLMPNNVRYYPIADNRNSNAVKSEDQVKVVREGDTVHIYMTAVRSHFDPDSIEGIRVGDTVYFHITNIEQDWDVPHGFAVFGARNSDLLIMPGETRTLKWVPKESGVFPFYCTDFCSALHQEMQGYVRVSPPGEKVALSWHGAGK